MAEVSNAKGNIGLIGKKESLMKFVYLLTKYGNCMSYPTELDWVLDIPIDMDMKYNISEIRFEKFKAEYEKYLGLKTITENDIVNGELKLDLGFFESIEETLIEKLKDGGDLEYFTSPFIGEGKWEYSNTLEGLVSELETTIEYEIKSDKKTLLEEKDESLKADIVKAIELTEQDLNLYNELVMSDATMDRLNNRDLIPEDEKYFCESDILKPYRDNIIFLSAEFVDHEMSYEVFYSGNMIIDVYTQEVMESYINDIPYTRENLVYTYEIFDEMDYFDDSDDSIEYFFDNYMHGYYDRINYLSFVNYLPNRDKILKEIKSRVRGYISGLQWDEVEDVIIDTVTNCIKDLKFIPKQVRPEFVLDYNNIEITEEISPISKDLILDTVVSSSMYFDGDNLNDNVKKYLTYIKYTGTIKQPNGIQYNFEVGAIQRNNKNTKVQYFDGRKLKKLEMIYEGKRIDILSKYPNCGFYADLILCNLSEMVTQKKDDCMFWYKRKIVNFMTGLQRYVIARELNKNKKSRDNKQE